MLTGQLWRLISSSSSPLLFARTALAFRDIIPTQTRLFQLTPNNYIMLQLNLEIRGSSVLQIKWFSGIGPDRPC